MSDDRRGLPTTTRDRIIRRDLSRCQMCHRLRPPSDLEIDHTIEVADGGTDDDGNLCALCHRCHVLKTNAAAKDRRKPVTLWRPVLACGFIITALAGVNTDQRLMAPAAAGYALAATVVVWSRWGVWRHRENVRAARLLARGRPVEPAAVVAVVVPAVDPLEAALTALTRGPVVIGQTNDRITVDYPLSFRDDLDDARVTLIDVVHAKIGGRWRAEWDTRRNRVTLDRRPELPRIIDRPTNPGSSRSVPFAVSEDGDVVIWEPDVQPHMLVAGDTGSGKSVLLRGVAMTCLEAGWLIRCCDPKRIELSPLRPLGIEVATTEDAMVTVVEQVHAEMLNRYAAIEAGDIRREDLTPMLLVVDEGMIWVQQMDAHWKATKERGQTGTSHPVVQQWQQVVILGRSARVFLLTGIQRPDAAMFGKDGGGATRDQYGCRVAVGPMKADGLRMMFGRSDIGRDIPVDVKGRATVAVGSAAAPFEAQAFYTP